MPADIYVDIGSVRPGRDSSDFMNERLREIFGRAGVPVFHESDVPKPKCTLPDGPTIDADARTITHPHGRFLDPATGERFDICIADIASDSQIRPPLISEFLNSRCVYSGERTAQEVEKMNVGYNAAYGHHPGMNTFRQLKRELAEQRAEWQARACGSAVAGGRFRTERVFDESGVPIAIRYIRD